MRWLLPHTPDVLGMLRRQLAVTIEGLDAFVEWAEGDTAAERRVRDCEHRADDVKRELHRALREAFVTPLEPEDLFALSVGIDRIVNQAKDTVRESEVMACPPDVPLNVGAHRRKVLGGPVHHHEMEAIVGRRATEGVAVAHVQLDIVLSDAAEVRVIGGGGHWANVVLRSSHRPCDE